MPGKKWTNRYLRYSAGEMGAKDIYVVKYVLNAIGRLQTFINMQELGNYCSHDPFLRNLLENELRTTKMVTDITMRTGGLILY